MGWKRHEGFKGKIQRIPELVEKLKEAIVELEQKKLESLKNVMEAKSRKRTSVRCSQGRTNSDK